jgi:superfamily II DNA or RNA helicase
VLHRALFGGVDLEVSAPALVREGLLAPYQELAFLTRPSPAEADYIHGESLRFAELRAGLLDPGFASVPFLGWLQARAVERRSDGGAQVSWTRFEKDEPAPRRYWRPWSWSRSWPWPRWPRRRPRSRR